MDRGELLTLMDLNMQEMYREDARATPGGFVVERDGLVLCGSPRGTEFTNMVMVARAVSPSVVHAALEETFGARGMACSVWTRAHADRELEEAMTAEGFSELMSVPGMVLPADGETLPSSSPELKLRVVDDDAGRDAYALVMADAWGVYGVDGTSTASHFATLDSVVGPTKATFLAYLDGEAVAGAMLYLSHGVGGIGWVGTRPTASGRGYGTAVTWAVVREGIRRGARFLNLQASPLGAPVYRRMGFSTPTHYRVFVSRR
jgi:hypothetical protein